MAVALLYYIVELRQLWKIPSILWDFQKRICRLWWNYRWNCDSYVCAIIKKENFISYFDLVMLQFPWHRDLGVLDVFVPVAAMERETHAWYGITFTHSDFAQMV